MVSAEMYRISRNAYLSTSHNTGQILVGFERRFMWLPDNGELGMQTLEASDR
jgi:hypothetical protein